MPRSVAPIPYCTGLCVPASTLIRETVSPAAAAGAAPPVVATSAAAPSATAPCRTPRLLIPMPCMSSRVFSVFIDRSSPYRVSAT